MSESNDIKNAPRDRVLSYLKELYINGTHSGNYFRVGNVKGEKGTSLSYDLIRNTFQDYAEPQQKGGNLAHLLAAKEGIEYHIALKQVRSALGLLTDGQSSSVDSKIKSAQRAMIPVPENAPELPVVVGCPHPSRDKRGYILRTIHDYRDPKGRLQLHVTRFENPERLTRKGKPDKFVMPLSYYEGEGWRWKGLGLSQNPIYGLDKLALRPDAYVLIVEGEKAADAAALLFPDFVPIAWLGGIGQLGKADFSPLRSRNVVYWPDADDAGAKSIDVVTQMLIEVGVSELSIVRPPPRLPEGWDVADPVPAELNLRELLRKASPPTAFQRALLRDLGLDALVERFVYNVETDQFVDLATGYRPQSNQVNNLYRHRETGMANKLLQDTRLLKVLRFAYMPGNEDRIVRENEDLQALNLWRPSNVVRQAGDAIPFVEHLRYLSSTNEEFEHLADMLAFMAQKLGRKLKSAIVLVGPQGTGKSFVGHVMREILGSHNSTEITSTEVKSDFNEFLEAKLFVVVDEIMALGRLEIMNKLKPLITQTKIQINRKHITTYEIENCANFLFLSNHEDALKIDNQDRRYFIVIGDGSPMPSSYYDYLWSWEEQHRGVILDWLLSRDLSGFNPDAPPPITEGKRRMVEASRDETEVLIAELIEARLSPFERDLVELKSIHNMIQEKSSGSKPTRPMIMRALRANGAADLQQKKGIINGVETRKSLWAIRDVEKYRLMSPQEVIERFIQGSSKSSKSCHQSDPEISF
jgi:hypothetical protein